MPVVVVVRQHIAALLDHSVKGSGRGLVVDVAIDQRRLRGLLAHVEPGQVLDGLFVQDVGGRVDLAESPLGGLRVRLTLPVAV